MRTLVTFGLGAAAMYLLDPQAGRRRRAQIRDQLMHAKRLVARRDPGTTRDLSYRAYAATETPQGAQHLGR